MSRHNLPPALASGAWREDDPVASRKLTNPSIHHLGNGEILPFVTFAYGTRGELDEASSNAVLAPHVLAGGTYVCGEAAPGQLASGWWEQTVGLGHIIDTDHYYVMVANTLGGCQGSTDPASPAPDDTSWGSRFPMISTHDQVYAESRLADLLSIDGWSIVVNTSLGRHRAIEWAVSYPERVRRLVIMVSDVQTTTDQVAWTHTQVRTIGLDPAWRGGDHYAGPDLTAGPALACQTVHMTYRFPSGLGERSGRIPQNDKDPLYGGCLAVGFYPDYHGEKIVRRFGAGSYVALCRTMLSHDVGRDRGGVVEALKVVTACTLVVAVDSDRLFSPEQV